MRKKRKSRQRHDLVRSFFCAVSACGPARFRHHDYNLQVWSTSTVSNKRTSGRVDEESSFKSFPCFTHSHKYKHCMHMQMLYIQDLPHMRYVYVHVNVDAAWRYIDALIHGMINNHDLRRFVPCNRKEHILHCISILEKIAVWRLVAASFQKIAAFLYFV